MTADGRPNIHDEKIAQAVHQLSMWGFPQRSLAGRTKLRSGVYEVVGLAACEVLKRTDPGGRRALGPDRIEQIYKLWMAAQRELRSFARYQRTGEIADVNPLFFERRQFTKAWLVRQRPPGSLRVLAKKLLQGWRPRVVDRGDAPVIEPDWSPRELEMREISYPVLRLKKRGNRLA